MSNDFSALDDTAKKIRQPKTKEERAKEIIAGVAVTALGVTGMIVCEKKIRKHGRKSRVTYSNTEDNLESVSITEVPNPDQNTAIEIMASVGMVMSSAATMGGLAYTAHAVLTPDKWITEREAAKLKKTKEKEEKSEKAG